MNIKTFTLLCIIMLLRTPAMADGNRAYIFGYGSLMLPPARTATAPDPEDALFIPVKISGIERLWNLWSEKSQQRALGVEPCERPDAFVNGLIFSVQKEQLSAFDNREGPGYQRIKVPVENLSFYVDEHRELVLSNEAVDVFFYAPRKDSAFYFDKSDTRKTIAMSYLNVVRAGCVSIDRTHQLHDQFTNDCVQTLGLEGYRIDDDREQPRYPRYPATLLENAMASGNTDQVKALKIFIEQDWESYLRTINEKWGF